MKHFWVNGLLKSEINIQIFIKVRILNSCTTVGCFFFLSLMEMRSEVDRGGYGDEIFKFLKNV